MSGYHCVGYYCTEKAADGECFCDCVDCSAINKLVQEKRNETDETIVYVPVKVSFCPDTKTIVSYEPVDKDQIETALKDCPVKKIIQNEAERLNKAAKPLRDAIREAQNNQTKPSKELLDQNDLLTDQTVALSCLMSKF